MTDHSDNKDIQKLLTELPEVILPDSLCADALFARMDAQAVTAASTQPATKSNSIIDITRRLRPVLSYAAVFAVLVLVYYGTGVDKSATTPMPMAEPQMMSDNAPVSSAAAAAANELTAAPQMDEMKDIEEDAPAPMAAAPTPSDDMAKASPRMAAAVSGELVDERDFGGLRATVHQLDNSVMIKLVNINDPETVLRTIVQDGSYTYMGEVGKGETAQLIVATLTTTNTQPVTQLDDGVQGNIANLYSYPASDHDRYMVLTVLGGSDSKVYDTAAVQGSNLILQAVGDSSFVVFSDAKQDATTVDTINLGNATIELR